MKENGNGMIVPCAKVLAIGGGGHGGNFAKS
jgi:hypothetical protein